jgi:hypothetical protein
MADIYISLAGAGAKDGTTSANALSFTDSQNNLQTSGLDQLTAGDILYVAEGTYDISATLNIKRNRLGIGKFRTYKLNKSKSFLS